ncbi:sugar ABC transporter ATP-binding protein [Nocardioides bruguierae]|uniref:sugar ABC transporter ATP-binding protein n=1 Tax=Nocardioides bruguierae TaxID=2945102 RepID=UPI002020B514|nr:sugar ABC transporter ATP-binding protein [Nocardioides bruguierae]MCL8023948.1 sugar ABC transporter ATP-binding protein [Nocardioides bruguierae]
MSRRPLELVSLRDLSVTFGTAKALDDVSVDVFQGRVTALLGMNGSGKSTLIKVLAGVYKPDAGATLDVRGAAVPLPLSPATSRDLGLRFLHQDLGVVPELTVAENFALVAGFPTRGPWRGIDSRRHAEQVAATLEVAGVSADPRTRMADLDPSTRTMVAIARLFAGSGRDGEVGESVVRDRLLVLDEPTASLPAEEVDRVLSLLERVRDLGGSIVYVSHRTDEVRRIADQLVVLRDGRLVADEPVGDRTADDIVSLVVGQKVERTRHARRVVVADGSAAALSVAGLHGPRLRDVSLRVERGEVVGVAGLVGCGRSELLRMVAGAQRPAAGSMTVDDARHAPRSPQAAIEAGVASVPQDRRGEGCVLPMSVHENLVLGHRRLRRTGTIDRAAERAGAADLMATYRVKTASPDLEIGRLSGGNQQKVVLARTASHDLKVLVLDEPTQGVDAHAKQEIARAVRAVAERGVGVLVGSSDFQELADLCDRVVVLDRGRVTGELLGEDLTEERIASLSTHHGAAPASSAPHTTPQTETREALA